MPPPPPPHPRRRHPDWIRARLPRNAQAREVRAALDAGGLHTVCEEAKCPNRGECWDAGAATFLILGDICTRGCAYCGVVKGQPAPPDLDEPRRMADAAIRLKCRYVVITSVTRDDLPDGGASLFAASVRALRETIPGVRVELLVPDFGGDLTALAVAVDSTPDVFGHNIEVVSRLFPTLRPRGDYERSLMLLRNAAQIRPGLITKSGLMIGLGETRTEITQAMRDLRDAGCRILTVGQYLQPTRASVVPERYVPPAEFDEIRDEALSLGFDAAACGPLVRSSYHAMETLEESISESKQK
jgi:lipoyl synthase